MRTSELEESFAAEAAGRPALEWRTIVLLGSGTVLLLCVGVAGFGWASSARPTSLLMIGDTTALRIGYIAGMIALAAFAVFIVSASLHRWWLIVAIPAAIAANLLLVLAMVLFPFTEMRVSPILVDGCSTGYVAVEQMNGSHFVGVRDGFEVVKALDYSADDFGMPFSQDIYSIRMTNNEIVVAYDGGAGFTLPIIATSSCSSR